MHNHKYYCNCRHGSNNGSKKDILNHEIHEMLVHVHVENIVNVTKDSLLSSLSKLSISEVVKVTATLVT